MNSLDHKYLSNSVDSLVIYRRFLFDYLTKGSKINSTKKISLLHAYIFSLPNYLISFFFKSGQGCSSAPTLTLDMSDMSVGYTRQEKRQIFITFKNAKFH